MVTSCIVLLLVTGALGAGCSLGRRLVGFSEHVSISTSSSSSSSSYPVLELSSSFSLSTWTESSSRLSSLVSKNSLVVVIPKVTSISAPILLSVVVMSACGLRIVMRPFRRFFRLSGVISKTPLLLLAKGCGVLFRGSVDEESPVSV